MKKTFLLAVALISFTSLKNYSQSDSVYAYLPLDIGNQWQFKTYQIVYGPPQTDTTTYYSFSVVMGDTIMPNGYQYQIIKSNDSTTRYIHIDSATACVYEYENDTSPGFKIDSLRCSEGDWFGNDNNCEFIDTATVLNYQTWVMGIVRPWPDITVSHTLAMDIGWIHHYRYESVGWGIETISNLVYAKIKGVEYGEMVNALSDIKNVLIDFNLQQNYPNPFNPATTIRFEIPKRSFVAIKVYDVLGNEIETLVNQEKPAGYFNVEFNGSNLTSGIYFYQLRSGSFVETKKMILMK